MGHNNKLKVIQSGSKAEGLDLKSSDLDLMSITPLLKVYQSEPEVDLDGLTVPLIMNTEETQPCFTQLRLLDHHQVFTNMWQKNHLGYMLSSEQYKLFYLSLVPGSWKIHGPCLSDMQGRMDLAFCLKCDRWIFQAEPWVSRARTTWPSSDIISKIISYGVLFVPIGIKGSVNENLEWRISFSIAEKFLIYSFSHVQLLCYAMLKVLVKEILEKHEDLKGLLCSYFLKTLMFWISEETDPNLWRPDNIIHCFNACVQRLLYCVRYTTLSHYFIPANNLLFNSVMNREKLTTILEKLYECGIYCFAYSDTLKDYKRQSYEFTESLTSRIVRTVHKTFCDYPNIKKIHLLYNCLHHSRCSLSGGLIALRLSKACWFALDSAKFPNSSDNKHQYFNYKYDLSHLLVGLHSDAVTGWLLLASFFYVHKKYFASLSVMNYALQKCTEEKIYSTRSEYTFIQNHELYQLKNEKLYTVLKAVTIESLIFHGKSSLLPKELQKDAIYDVLTHNIFYYPLSFAYFLSFLCFYHLHDLRSSRYYFQKLKSTDDITTPLYVGATFCSPIFDQLMGDTYLSRHVFQETAIDDQPGTTIMRVAAEKIMNEFKS
ncbi:uncharacterized protein LOC134701268 [Mytilus trossulus]|uniref:uncharacterized protein LOC134701268 n=1 Tax=Mytilus trossulus TaxID=6551 RepID=UPI0030063225